MFSQPSIAGASYLGVVAESAATCFFTLSENVSLGLAAVPWFQRAFNDSWTWEHNTTLTWTFDPNLLFWTFFYEEVERITAMTAPGVTLTDIGWGVPVEDPWKPDSHHPYGDVITYNNNGTYYTTALALYPQFDDPNLRFNNPPPVENLTFILSDQRPGTQGLHILPPADWACGPHWDAPEGMSDAAWTEAADRISTLLNETWYLKSCYIPKAGYLGNESHWPLIPVILGLLVAVGLGSKRRLSTKKRVA